MTLEDSQPLPAYVVVLCLRLLLCGIWNLERLVGMTLLRSAKSVELLQQHLRLWIGETASNA